MWTSIIQAIGIDKICDNCSKYVLNSCHSKCGLGSCCFCDIETDEIEIEKDDGSEVSAEINGCCHVNHKD